MPLPGWVQGTTQEFDALLPLQERLHAAPCLSSFKSNLLQEAGFALAGAPDWHRFESAASVLCSRLLGSHHLSCGGAGLLEQHAGQVWEGHLGT